MKVYDRLKNGTIEEARYAVSMIVGRDTQALSEIGVTKAAVETVAENSSDGIIAPYVLYGNRWNSPDVFVQGHQHYVSFSNKLKQQRKFNLTSTDMNNQYQHQ